MHYFYKLSNQLKMVIIIKLLFGLFYFHHLVQPLTLFVGVNFCSCFDKDDFALRFLKNFLVYPPEGYQDRKKSLLGQIKI